MTARAGAEAASPTSRLGQHTVNLAAHTVNRDDGTDAKLIPTQWSMLEILLRNPGKLISQRQLLHDVWGRNTRPRPTTCASTGLSYASSSNPTPPDPATSSPNPAWVPVPAVVPGMKILTREPRSPDF